MHDRKKPRPHGELVERVGTLELIDTGQRCTVRNVRIYAVWCPHCGGDSPRLHDGIKEQFWSVTKMFGGYHHGCDPASDWNKNPVGMKLQHNTQKSILDRADACPACNEVTCSGASS